jgi:signal transduction histidine kinase/Tfp pilus assembly protein PilF
MNKNLIINIVSLLLLLLISISNFSQESQNALVPITRESDFETKKAHIKFIFDLLKTEQDSAYLLMMDFQSKIKAEEKEIFIRFKNIVATYYWDIGEFDTAAIIYAQNIDTAEKYQIIDQKINAMSNLGAILNVMGQPDSAYFYLKQSLPLAIEQKDDSKIAKIRFDLGNYYKKKGFYHLALEQLQLAEEYYNEAEDSPLIVYVYNTLGTLYTALGEPEKAKYYFHKAIKIDLARDDVYLLHDLYNNLGVCLWKLEDNFDSARYYMLECYNISLRYNSPNHQLVYLLNLGGMESKAGNFAASYNYLSKAEKLESQVNNPYKLSALYVNLGTYHYFQKHYTKAREYYLKGIPLAESIDAYDNLYTAYHNLFQLDSTTAQYLSAIKHSQMALVYYDSLNNIEKRKNVAELEIIHEKEQTEQANKLLKEQNDLQSQVIQVQRKINIMIGIGLFFFFVFSILLMLSRKKIQDSKSITEKKNTEINQKNALIEEKNKDLQLQKTKLEELNQTKDKFFAIIAHDLRSPFSSLLGLLDILETDFNDLEDSKKIEIIGKLANSGRNTYNMLLNLLDWARSQRGHIQAEIIPVQIDEIVESAKVFLSHRIEDKQHHVDVKLQDSLKVMADKNLLLTIMINILNNAIKFTNREGKIMIESLVKDGITQISISDNGVGIAPEKLSQLFRISDKESSKGTEDELGTGLGLILANEFALLMNAQIIAESEVGKGSVFHIKIPSAG